MSSGFDLMVNSDSDIRLLEEHIKAVEKWRKFEEPPKFVTEFVFVND